VVPKTSEVLITYSDVCVTGPWSFRAEGWGFAEYNWNTNSLDVSPDDVVRPPSTGAELPSRLVLGNPVFNGGAVTLFSFDCTSLYVGCSSGQVYAATLPGTVGALSQPGSYAVNPVATDGSTSWQPVGISVGSYADTPLRMIETTSATGSYDVLTASTPAGPWHLETTGVVPGCQGLPSGFCYALMGHPEVSTASQLVISYYDPGAGPAGPTGPVGHMVGVGTSYTEPVPFSPERLSAVAGTTSVELTWSPPANGADGVIYNIYRSTTPDRELSDFAAPIASGVTGTSYTDRGLAPGWSYYYAVSATNSLGFEGLASTEAGATTRLGSLTITPQTLIQHHADGSIWQYAPHAGLWGSNWLMLDNNPGTVHVVTDGTNLYQLHGDGSIWRYTGTPLTGWTLLDVNPATVQIAAGAGELYQRHRDGSIWQYGPHAGLWGSNWVMLDNNPATVDVVTDGTSLYQLHGDGSIWRYGPHAGLWGSNWVTLDNNPATVQIAAGGGELHQRHRDGSIWQYEGPAILGWVELDANPATDLITVAT
jgi:hypothetical protein